YLWGRVYPGRRGWERHSRRSIVTLAGIKPAPHTKCGGAARRLGVSVGPGLSRPTGLGTALQAEHRHARQHQAGPPHKMRRCRAAFGGICGAGFIPADGAGNGTPGGASSRRPASSRAPTQNATVPRGVWGYLWGRVYPGRRGWERHSRRSIVTPAGIKPARHTKCDGAARRLGVSVGPGLSRPTGLGTTLRAGSAPPLAGLKPALPGSERPSRLPGQQKRPPRFPGATLVQPREPFYARLLLTTSYTSGDSSPLARMRSSPPRISAWRAGANLRQRVSGASWRAAICGLKPFSAIT